jgi:hypothetical protein
MTFNEILFSIDMCRSNSSPHRNVQPARQPAWPKQRARRFDQPEAAGRSQPRRLAVENTADPPMKTLTLTCPPRDTLA